MNIIIARVPVLNGAEKFGLRMCLKSWNLNYDELLEKAMVPSLKARRTQIKICHLFKIIKKMTDYPDAPITLKIIPYKSRSNNCNTFYIPKSNTLSHQHSLFPSALMLWNKLPEDIGGSGSLITFKRQL